MLVSACTVAPTRRHGTDGRERGLRLLPAHDTPTRVGTGIQINKNSVEKLREVRSEMKTGVYHFVKICMRLNFLDPNTQTSYNRNISWKQFRNVGNSYRIASVFFPAMKHQIIR